MRVSEHEGIHSDIRKLWDAYHQQHSTGKDLQKWLVHPPVTMAIGQKDSINHRRRKARAGNYTFPSRVGISAVPRISQVGIAASNVAQN